MISTAWLYRLKAAQKDLINMNGGIQKTADKSNFGKSQIGRCHDLEAPDLMPLHVVLVLEADCGVPVVTSVMAEINGRRITDDAEPSEAGTNVLVRYSETVAQIAELMTSGAASLADLVVTPAEAIKMDREASQLERSLHALRQSLAKVRADGGEVIQFGKAAE